MLRLPRVVMGRKVLLQRFKCLGILFHSPAHLQDSQPAAGDFLPYMVQAEDSTASCWTGACSQHRG